MYVDGAYHGEMKANAACDADGYQYSVDDLTQGQSYDIAVKVCNYAVIQLTPHIYLNYIFVIP